MSLKVWRWTSREANFIHRKDEEPKRKPSQVLSAPPNGNFSICVHSMDEGVSHEPKGTFR
jgi:hypothetical protein